MSFGRSSKDQIRMEQELAEVSARLIRQTNGGTIGLLENINSPDGESFMKLVESTVMSRLQPTLEELYRGVRKEMMVAFGNLFTGNPANQFHFSEQRRLLLKFKYKLLQPVWSGIPLKNEMGTSIEIELLDRLTGAIINFGPEASLKVEIVVLKGDDENDREFDVEGFERSIIREGVGNKPLLDGDVFLDLKEGIGFSGEIKFSHRSIWMKNQRYRLGARVVDNIYANRVRAAVSESFQIRDRRIKLYQKHKIPSLSDEVWRLKNISRRGPFYKRLKEGNITTVEGFLNEHNTNPEKLKQMGGTGRTAMSDKKMKEAVAHALKYKVDTSYQIVPQELDEVIPVDENSNLPSYECFNISNTYYASYPEGLESFGPQSNVVDNHENAYSCNSDQGFTSSGASYQDFTSSGASYQDITSSGASFQDLTSPGVSNQSFTSPGASNQGFTSSAASYQGFISPGVSNQGFTSSDVLYQGFTSPGVSNQVFTSHGASNQGFTSSGVPYQDFTSPGVSNQVFTSPGASNQGYTLSGVSSYQGFTSPGVSNHVFTSHGASNQGFTSSGAFYQDFPSLGVSNQVFTSPGASNQGFTSSGASYQDLTSPGVSNQSFTSPGASNQGFTSSAASYQGFISPGVSNQGFTSSDVLYQGFTSPGVSNQVFTSHGASNQGFTSSGVPYQDFTSPGVSNQVFTSPGASNQGYTLSGVSSYQGFTSPGVSNHVFTSHGASNQGFTSSGAFYQDFPSLGVSNQVFTSPGASNQGFTSSGAFYQDFPSLGVSNQVFTSPGASNQGFTSSGASYQDFTSSGASYKGFTSSAVSNQGFNSPGASNQSFTSPGASYLPGEFSDSYGGLTFPNLTDF